MAISKVSNFKALFLVIFFKRSRITKYFYLIRFQTKLNLFIQDLKSEQDNER